MPPGRREEEREPEHEVDGEELHAVIWFSDLRNSTRLAETLSRNDYLAALNQYFDCVAGTVIEHGGEVLKFIGDAVLAIFAIDDQNGSSPAACRQALIAVRDAQERINAVNREREMNAQPPLAFGTGLHRGSITYGNIGTSRRLDFTVIGPAVNIASRLETLTKDVGRPVLLSRAFVERAGCENDVEDLGAFELKGLGEAVDVSALRFD